ncbi:hypothetical protein HDU93_007987, partial [Gonapodya sp. JEL0774]
MSGNLQALPDLAGAILGVPGDAGQSTRAVARGRGRGRGRGDERGGSQVRGRGTRGRGRGAVPSPVPGDPSVAGEPSAEPLAAVPAAEASQFRWSNPAKRIDLLKECLDKKPYMKGRELDPITKNEKVVTIAEKWERIAKALEEKDSVTYAGVTGRGCMDAVKTILKKVEGDNMEALLKSGTDEQYTELEELANNYSEEYWSYDEHEDAERAKNAAKRAEDEAKVAQLMLDAVERVGDRKRRQSRSRSRSVDLDEDDTSSIHGPATSSKRPRNGGPNETLAHVAAVIAESIKESAVDRKEARETQRKEDHERWEADREDRREARELERERLRLQRDEAEQHR